MGDTALITCVVSNQGDHSLVWRKVSKSRGPDTLLTVNTEVVAEDRRVGVLHEEEGQVFVLVVRNLTAHDAGLYSCELSTQPPTIIRHQLQVLPARRVIKYEDLERADTDIVNYDDIDDYDDYDQLKTFVNQSQAGFDACCVERGVWEECRGWCDLDTLYYRSSHLARAQCEDDLDKIYSCLADGRNHAPCCLDSGVPELCTDLCTGIINHELYNSLLIHILLLTGGLMKSIRSGLVRQCAQYTPPILTCVAAGVQSIPR